MTPGQLATAILDRLRTSRLAIHDGPPPVTPDRPYVVFYGSGGLAWQDRYEGGSRTYTYTCRVMCVARTTAGLRDATHAVRELLTDWRPDPHPAASPLWEEVAGPELTDGPTGDERHSITLEYRLTTRR